MKKKEEKKKQMTLSFLYRSKTVDSNYWIQHIDLNYQRVTEYCFEIEWDLTRDVMVLREYKFKVLSRVLKNNKRKF